MESYISVFSVIGLFHLASCPQLSSVLQQVTGCPSLLILISIPLCVYTTLCLSLMAFGLLLPLGCCQYAAMNMGISCFNIFEILFSLILLTLSRSEILELFGNSVLILLRNCYTVFHSPWKISIPVIHSY